MSRNERAIERPWRFPKNRIILGNRTKANINNQNYSVIPEPYYYDVELRCVSCNKSFVFTAKEQQYWYEVLGFWIDSVPKKCPACRAGERTRKQVLQGLGELTKTEALILANREKILQFIELLIDKKIKLKQPLYDKLARSLWHSPSSKR